MLTFTKMANGNLKITADEEERDEIREMIAAGHDYFRISGTLLEEKLGNGWEWLTPEECGALTDDSNVILSDDVLRGDNDNEVLYIGNVWFDNYYAIRDWYGKLADEGEVVFYNGGVTEYTDDETTAWLKEFAARTLPYGFDGPSRLRAAFIGADDALTGALDIQNGHYGEYDSNDNIGKNLRKLAMLRQMRERVLGDKYVMP